MMSCSFGEVRAYRNAGSVPWQFKRPLSPELCPECRQSCSIPSAVESAIHLHGLGEGLAEIWDQLTPFAISKGHSALRLSLTIPIATTEVADVKGTKSVITVP